MHFNLDAWTSQEKFESAKSYKCGHCGRAVAARTGYGGIVNPPPNSQGARPKFAHWITLCPNCAKPTFWDGDKQVPGVTVGDDVMYLPADIDGLYRETRNCMSVCAYTAGAMACRKILMNVAVSLGAAVGLKFVQYVDYIANNGYVAPNAKKWVDHIRDKGNDATHEIPSFTEPDLSDLLIFTEFLLKTVYEFPNRQLAAGS